MRLEWDSRKAASNLRKHGISFAEAATVFEDPHALTFHDPDHSDDEERYVSLGYTIRERLVTVIHTDRGERTRIISARLSTKRERIIYEEE